MKIGQVYLYKKKPVYITGGQVYSNGRLSNFWTFRYIKKDGYLGKTGGDYDNEVGKFEPYRGKVKLRIELKRELTPYTR